MGWLSSLSAKENQNQNPSSFKTVGMAKVYAIHPGWATKTGSLCRAGGKAIQAGEIGGRRAGSWVRGGSPPLWTCRRPRYRSCGLDCRPSPLSCPVMGAAMTRSRALIGMTKMSSRRHLAVGNDGPYSLCLEQGAANEILHPNGCFPVNAGASCLGGAAVADADGV